MIRRSGRWAKSRGLPLNKASFLLWKNQPDIPEFPLGWEDVDSVPEEIPGPWPRDEAELVLFSKRDAGPLLTEEQILQAQKEIPDLGPPAYWYKKE